MNSLLQNDRFTIVVEQSAGANLRGGAINMVELFHKVETYVPAAVVDGLEGIPRPMLSPCPRCVTNHDDSVACRACEPGSFRRNCLPPFAQPLAC